MRLTLKTFVLSTFVAVLSAVALGQGGAATGDLFVTVKDPRGNVVTNATVKVRDIAKGLERSATATARAATACVCCHRQPMRSRLTPPASRES